MKKAVRWWAVHALHWAMLYAAFVLSIDGALYVVKFFTWALAILGPFMLTDASVANSAKRPPTKWTSDELAWLQAWATLVLLVWYGHIASGAAWGWFMAVHAWHMDQAKKLRAAPQAT